jgi:CTP synthase
LNLLIIIGGYPDIGKGTLTAASGYLLQQAGFVITPIKFDGFLNRQSDPFAYYRSARHFQFANEEVFGLSDGGTADNDLGYYERFMDVETRRTHQLTNGDAFAAILDRDRCGYYPSGEILNFNHIRDFLKDWVLTHLKTSDIVILEIGGTVGDRESEMMFEALQAVRRGGVYRTAVALVAPYFPTTDPQGFSLSGSTKLARQSAGVARKLGLAPDIILLRSSEATEIVPNDEKYVAFETGIDPERIIDCPFLRSTYQLPGALVEHGYINALGELFDLEISVIDGPLEAYSQLQNAANDVLKVAMPGKERPSDSQISLEEALNHAATSRGAVISRVWLEDLATTGSALDIDLKEIDMLLIPDAPADQTLISRALCVSRTIKLPTLAISHGADLLIVDYARNVCGRREAFIEKLEEGQGDIRIQVSDPACGDWFIKLTHDSLASRLYNQRVIIERSWHCTWPSEALVNIVNEQGLRLTGVGANGTPEIFELSTHPFFVAIKPRPEYKSRPMRPSALFLGLIDAALARRVVKGK